jgi:DNA-binding NtrC family response regulator
MEAEEILLIDDDGDGCLSLSRALKASGVVSPIHASTHPTQALELASNGRLAVVVLDLCLDERRGVDSGFELLQELVRKYPYLRVIILTGHGGEAHGVRALTLGAANFLEKPAYIPHLVALIQDGISQSKLRRAVLRGENSVLAETLVGSSPATEALREKIRFAAHNSQSIFLAGETGVGKGLCALLIHRLSKRRAGKFVRYQPNFSNPDLVNSDLFGHRRGAFTGAAEDRRGLLADANDGTLFLDEVDELPLECQVTLLGVLQEKRFRPVGGSQEQSTDFRLITASNCALQQALSQGKMRRDFYHRIAQHVIDVPALRQRKEDIPELCVHILSGIAAREEINLFACDDDVIKKLQGYEWPGNIRELQSVVEGAALRAQYRGAQQIELIDLGDGICRTRSSGLVGPNTIVKSFADTIEDFKLKLIEEALDRHNGNQVQAAQELNLDRSTMRRIISRRDRSA